MRNPLKKKEKGLADILGTFTKTLADLDALINRNSDQISANETVILELQAESEALGKEAQRAMSVAARIEELIS